MAQIPADPLAWGAPAGSVEVLGHRRQGAKTFRHADGRHHTAVFGGVLHYEPTPGAGGWEEADTLFRPSGAGQTADRLPFGVTINGTNLDLADRATSVGIRYTVPAQGVTVDGSTISFSFVGIAWTYTVTKSGLKLEGLVPSPRGATSFSFSYARLGGQGLALQPDGGVAGEGFVLPPPTITGADGVTRRDLTSWSLSPSSLTLDLDDTSLPPEAYPYVLDPSTSFVATASGNDGYTSQAGAAYPPTNPAAVDTTNTIVAPERSLYAGPTYTVACGLVGFDTSTLPDGATVTAATLRLYGENRSSGDGLSFVGDWFDYGAAIDTADHTNTAPSGTAFAAVSLGTLALGATNDLALLDVAASVSKTGITKIRTGISGTTPTSTNYFYFAAFDHATDPEPQLIVTWTAPLGIYAVEAQVVATSGVSATAIAATLPSAPTAGNLLVAMVDCAGLVTPTATGAWNKLTQVQSTDTGCMFWKLVPASDTALQTLTSAGTGSSWAVVIQEFTGVDPTTQLLIENDQASTTTAKASPSVSPAAGLANALLVGGAFSDGSRSYSAQAFTGSNVGAVAVAGSPTTGATTTGESCSLWYAVVSSTTGAYAATATCSAADGGGCAVALFRPAAPLLPLGDRRYLTAVRRAATW